MPERPAIAREMIDPPTTSDIRSTRSVPDKCVGAPPKPKRNDPAITESNARLYLLVCILYMLMCSVLYYLATTRSNPIISTQGNVIIRLFSLLLFFVSGIIAILALKKCLSNGKRTPHGERTTGG